MENIFGSEVYVNGRLHDPDPEIVHLNTSTPGDKSGIVRVSL